MVLTQPLGQLFVQADPGLTAERVDEQPAAHADPAVDPPYRQLEAAGGQRLLPGDHMLIHRVDESAVQVEQQRGLRHQLQWISQRDRNPTITYSPCSARCGAEVDRCSDTALGG